MKDHHVPDSQLCSSIIIVPAPLLHHPISSTSLPKHRPQISCKPFWLLSSIEMPSGIVLGLINNRAQSPTPCFGEYGELFWVVGYTKSVSFLEDIGFARHTHSQLDPAYISSQISCGDISKSRFRMQGLIVYPRLINKSAIAMKIVEALPLGEFHVGEDIPHHPLTCEQHPGPFSKIDRY